MRQQKFQTDRANWALRQSEVSNFLSDKNPSPSINKEAATLQKSIRFAANKAIPQTHYKPNKQKKVPWWNKETAELREIKTIVWKKLKKIPAEFPIS